MCAAGGCGSLIWKQWRLLFLIESMALSGSTEDSSLGSSKTTPHDLQTEYVCGLYGPVETLRRMLVGQSASTSSQMCSAVPDATGKKAVFDLGLFVSQEGALFLV